MTARRLFGIVYHASYLRFVERGRTNYLRLLGADHVALFASAAAEAPGFAFAVRTMHIEFVKPARMDDVLEIETTPQEVKGASMCCASSSAAATRSSSAWHLCPAGGGGPSPKGCGWPCRPIGRPPMAVSDRTSTQL